MNLLLSLRSESLKLKRTVSLYICVLAAAFGPLMSFLENTHPHPEVPRGQPWTAHFMEGREPLCIALLPMYVILVCTLLLQLEYRDKTWKQVFTSPQRVINIFAAKYLTLQLLVLAFLFAYVLFLAMAGYGTEIVQPALYDGELDYSGVLTTILNSWILVQGMSAIQFWLALRFRNFIAPVSIGVALWFAAPMMLFEFKTGLVEYHPYALTMLTVIPDYSANVNTHLWYSGAITIIFLGVAFLELRKRKVRS